ncbi:MAG: peptidoglycan-binding domain-containing protein [Myxococcaceae bacterium]
MRIDAPAAPVVVPVSNPEPSRAAPAPALNTVEVLDAQNALLRAGGSLTRFGADGQPGPETAAAVITFQKAHGLAATGRFDAATLEALAKAPSPATDQAALWADGVLRGVLAVGFDEDGTHRFEGAKLELGLAERGFHEVTPDERRALGLDADGRFVTRTFERDGRPARVLLELVSADTPHAKDRFAAALRTQELVLYGGHGRYGSGPDFDDIHSPAGNFVIGAPFEAGHVTLGVNDLDAAPLTPGYQVMFFDGCNTFRYFDDLRARATGKSSATLDVIGSNTELYWNATAANLLAALDAVSEGQTLGQLEDTLDGINRDAKSPSGHAFRGDGFEDNQ